MRSAASNGGERFRDQQLWIGDFTADEVLVRCPRCERCAKVVVVPGAPPTERILFAPRRLVCGRCGHTQDARNSVQLAPAPLGNARDPFLQHPLWLQADFDEHVLWAYNERHLDYLEAYVAARIREQQLPADGGGLRLMTMLAALPTWLKAAKNRERILRRIGRMRATLRPSAPDDRSVEGKLRSSP